MATTALSADPTEYRARLGEQPDAQIDTWVQELLRDVAKRRGIVRAVEDFRRATALGEAEFEHVFASGGGAPATAGRDRDGRLLVPATSLHALVPGLRRRTADARARLIDYLAASFDEIVYA